MNKGCGKYFYNKTGIKMKCGSSIKDYFPSCLYNEIKLCDKCKVENSKGTGGKDE